MDNNDIGEKINKLLEDPGALAGLMSIAGSLMKNQDTSSPVRENTSGTASSVHAAGGEESPNATESRENHVPVGNFESDGNSGKEIEQPLAALAGLLTKQKANDPRCALLYALKPYMSHDRAEKIETLVKILKLSDIAGGFFGNLF